MYIGNIITTLNIKEDNFNIISSLEECIKDIPTLIIGWKLTKEIIPDVSIIKKELNTNLFWTFTPQERKVDYEGDIEEFKKRCYNHIGHHLHYIYVDPLYTNKKIIKKIINKIYTLKRPISYINNNNMLYIFDENLVFGIDLNIMEFIGISTSKIINKITSLPDSILIRNQVFNKCKSIIKKINKNDKIIPYVYRYGECSEDNNPSLFCNK